MENLSIGHIAAAVVIVEFFNLAIILLTKTETILKIVERIKGVVGLDYRSRAKRSDNEVRITKKHAQVAKEIVRNTFVSMKKWRCNWTWNWSDNFEPINIKGYCLGDKKGYGLERVTYPCNNPVYGGYWNHELPEDPNEAQLITLGISCTDHTGGIHRPIRETFTMYLADIEGTSDVMLNSIMAKAILSERDLRIAKEIEKLRRKFWR